MHAHASRPAVDITGSDPAGEVVELRLERSRGRILLAFLTTDCNGCLSFWDSFRRVADAGLPPDVSAVVITKGPGSVSPRDVAALASGIDRVPVIMSDKAWTDFGVLGYPFFVVVEVATRSVIGETVGFSWDDVLSILAPTG